jgi:ribosomal protein L11 methyltransferase
MYTIKVDLTLAQCDEMEDRLLIVANELGKPLNFSLLRIAEKKRALLTGYFKTHAEASAQLKLIEPLPQQAVIHHGVLHNRDWQDWSKHHFKPFTYRNFAWVPNWLTDKELSQFLKSKKLSSIQLAKQNPKNNSTVIRLEIGMAFGTGNHPTTRLCLRQLVETMENYSRPTLLDVGCGSGILGITAEKLGAKKVIGFDIDEHSIAVARRNAKMNASRAKFSVGDVYADQLPVSDIVLANLLGNLIIDNAHKLWEAVANDGTLILSGLLVEELDKIARFFPAPARAYKLGKWGVLVIKKPQSR